MSAAPADHVCQVPGCGRFGAFGRRQILANWREGYVWWCSDHKHLMPATSAQRQPVKPTLDKGGQGRLGL